MRMFAAVLWQHRGQGRRRRPAGGVVEADWCNRHYDGATNVSLLLGDRYLHGFLQWSWHSGIVKVAV